MTKISVAALGAAIVLSATPAFAQMSVREIGSFHLGGRQVTLEGLPVEKIVFSPGAPADPRRSQRRFPGRADVCALRAAHEPARAIPC